MTKEIIGNLERLNENIIVQPCDVLAEKKEYMELLKIEIKKWRTRFTREQDRQILDAIILLILNPDYVDILNKKGIYLYIREITSLSTKQIVNSLTKFKKRYNTFKQHWHNGEI